MFRPGVDCGAIPAAKNNSNAHGNGTLFGDQLTYACREGYQIVGGGGNSSVTGTCQHNSQWSITTGPECESQQCPPFTGGSNVLVLNTDSTLKYKVGTSITLTCPTGYNLHGYMRWLCSTSRHWVAINSSISTSGSLTNSTVNLPSVRQTNGTICHREFFSLVRTGF